MRARPVRAALVEAKPTPALRVRDGGGGGDDGGDRSVKVQLYRGGAADRTDDIQAEVRALARAANASVYSPELLVVKYGSSPVKVTPVPLASCILCACECGF